MSLLLPTILAEERLTSMFGYNVAFGDFDQTALICRKLGTGS